MSFYDRIDTGVLAEFSVAKVLPKTMAGQFWLGDETQSKMDNSMSRHKVLSDAYQSLIDQIEDVSGEKFIKQGPDGINSSYQPVDQTFRVGGNPIGLGLLGPVLDIFATVTGPKVNEADAQSIFAKMEELGIDGPRSIQEVQEIANENARLQQEEMMAIEELQPGWKPWIGRMGGRMKAIFEDPVNVYTLPFGATKGMSISKMLFTDFVVNAGAEAAIQPSVKKWYNDLGLEYDIGDVMAAIGTAGLFGAGFGVTIRVGGETIRLSAEQVQKGLAAFRKTDLPASTELNQALEAVDNITEMETENPLSDLMEHTNRLNAAMDQIDNNAANMPEKPISEVTGREKGPGIAFDPDEIKVDAKTFQFKEDTADEFGVVDDFRNVDVWDQDKAGVVTVFEYRDGNVFIADGHQRLGIAKRAKAKGQEGVRVFANVIREADGFTPDMARVTAAIKNIAEGTGTAIDAAKVLRDFPERMSELDGVAKSLVRTSRGLSNLSDDAFGMVINEVIDARMGAVVGRLVQDKELHSSIASILRKTNPANEFEAEAIVRQALEGGTQKTKSLSLFGEEELSESLFLERARILDRTQKAIRKDRSIFNSLIKNADQVESAGNKLVSEVNQRKVATDGEILEILQKNANRVGPISDALNRAASDAKQSGSFTEATDGFLSSIRRAAEDGNLEGPGVNDIRRVVDDPEEVSSLSQAANDDLKAFDLVGSEGPKRQGDQLEQDLVGERPDVEARPREGFLDDNEARQDLKRVIEDGADEVTIDNHPAVTQAIENSKAIPETHLRDDYLSEAWEEGRVYNFDGEEVTGTKQAIARLAGIRAKDLAWTDDNLEPPNTWMKTHIKQEKKAVIILGPPAAGKSSIANPIARKIGAAIVDPDDAKKVMPEFGDGIGANAVHEESAELASRVLNFLTEERSNVVIPKVGSRAESIRATIKDLKEKGYEVDLVDMSVKYKIARDRMFLRFIDKGRLIDPDYVRSVGEKPGKVFDELQSENIADGYTRIDNNGKTKEDVKAVPIDTRNLLEGTDIRFRRGLPEGRGPGEKVVQDSEGQGFQSGRSGDSQELDQAILDQEIPIGRTVDEAGEVVSETQTVRDILKDIDQDQRMLNRLEGCAL